MNGIGYRRRRAMFNMAGAAMALWTLDVKPTFAEPCWRQIRLSSGRCLGYQRFGQDDGFPILYFHGTPGCRLEASLFDRPSREAGVCLIGVDRPGMGRSTYVSHYNHCQWARDIRELCESLSIKSTGILALSGGTSFSLVCAQQLSTLVAATAILSPRVPNADSLPVTPIDKTLERVVRHPSIARSILERTADRARRRPERPLNAPISKHFAPVDRCFLDNNSAWARDVFLETQPDSALGIVQDMRLLRWPWCIDLGSISSPVHLWQGSCDYSADVQTCQFLQKRIPNCSYTIVQNAGHITVAVDAGREALNWLTSNIATREASLS